MIPLDRHDSWLVPRDEVAARIDRLRAQLRERRVGLAWIEHLTDRYYLSGSAQDGVLLIPAEDEAVFLVRKSRERAEAEAGVAVEGYPGRQAVLERARRLAAAGGIGLAMDVTPAATALWLQREIAGAALTDVGVAVRELRAVKSPWEQSQARRAVAQAVTIYGEIGEHLRAGIGELELTGIIEGRMRALGHAGTVRTRRPGSDISLATIVSGASALYPTNFNGPVGAEAPYPSAPSGAGWKDVAGGETVMFDIVTNCNGYHGDTTRSFFVGDSPPPAALEAHDFCRWVLAEIESRLRPGARCSDVYREVTALAEAKGEPQGFMGYGENRVRFLGHGIGLELDELPVLAAKIDTELRPGMVLAVEPKAFLDGVGPVGVENTYLVTDDGCENLCPADDALLTV